MVKMSIIAKYGTLISNELNKRFNSFSFRIFYHKDEMSLITFDTDVDCYLRRYFSKYRDNNKDGRGRYTIPKKDLEKIDKILRMRSKK